jgi:hypothetical protein
LDLIKEAKMTEIKKKIIITTLGTSVLTNCDQHYKEKESLELTDRNLKNIVDLVLSYG